MNPSPSYPVQITFRHLAHSDAVEAKVRERAEKLSRFYPRILRCTIAVESLHRHHSQGNHFQVRVTVSIPGHELVSGHDRDEHHSFVDVYVAIRDAFDVMQRQLEDVARHQQGKVKLHDEPLQGAVIDLNPIKDCGQIELPDGRHVYFHRNSLVNGDFDRLAIGSQVRLTETLGEDGPQASTVYLIGKQRPAGQENAAMPYS